MLSRRRTYSHVFVVLGIGYILGVLTLVDPLLARGQVSVATATPVATVTPPAGSPTPTPTATPSPTPNNPVSYAPMSATVQLVASNNSANSSAAKRKGIARQGASHSQAQVRNGSDTATSSVQTLQINSPDLFSATALAATQPEQAVVTLTYDTACAGGSVWVEPLDGGAVNGSLGAKTITVGADGTLTFSFQAPSGPGRYHIVTRLGDTEVGFPFDVANAAVSTPTSTPIPSPTPTPSASPLPTLTPN